MVAGGSTIWLAPRVKELVSVEHDEEYFKEIKKSIENINCKSVDLRLMERPYCGICDEFEDGHFDVVFVDGRDRVKCIKAAIRVLKPQGTLFLDDSQRHYYLGGISLLKTW